MSPITPGNPVTHGGGGALRRFSVYSSLLCVAAVLCATSQHVYAVHNAAQHYVTLRHTTLRHNTLHYAGLQLSGGGAPGGPRHTIRGGVVEGIGDCFNLEVRKMWANTPRGTPRGGQVVLVAEREAEWWSSGREGYGVGRASEAWGAGGGAVARLAHLCGCGVSGMRRS